MRPDQLPLLRQVSTPSVHPDGEWCVVAVTRPDLRADAYVGQLWRVPLAGGEPRRLTRGFRDTAPQVSPDGSLVAFLRASQSGAPQLAVVAADGGEPMVVTEAKKGVGSFAWAPDSRRLAYVTRVPEEGRYGTLDGVGADAEDPRHITTLKFHSNGLGYTGDQRKQLFVLEVPDVFAEPAIKPVGRAARDEEDVTLVPAPTRLFEGDADVDHPFFTADGEHVVVTAALHDGADADLVTDLYRIPVGGGEPERLTGNDLAIVDGVAVGQDIFFLADVTGESRRDFVGQNPGVHRLTGDGGQAERLTDAETIHVGAIFPAADGVLAIEDHRGLSRLHHVTADADEVVLDGMIVTGAAQVPGTGAVVASVVTPTSAGDVVLVDGDRRTVLTDFSAELRAATTIVEPTELVATAPDGYPVHGWTLVPAGEGPHPVLLVIHGGPFAYYTGAFFDEFQVYVEAGYAVVACNPRGSAGYGEAHGKAIKADMGNLDFGDIMAFFDHALATVEGLDPHRIGVMGGSYGGYMTAWIISHDHRFDAAIVERGFLDAASFTGASDIGWFFQHEYNTSDRATMDAQSPMTLVDKVTTPTLVIHSEKDYRCPISQGYRYYTELKMRGIDAELLAFPGEDHELSRSGTPWHRVQRFEAILDWWSRHLGH